MRRPPPTFALTACTGKARFSDPVRARKAAKRRPGRHAYRCRCCDAWHVGTSDHKANLIGKNSRR